MSNKWYVVCILYKGPLGFGKFDKTYQEVFAESAEDAAVKMRRLYNIYREVKIEFVFQSPQG